jgi:hypothetical protein
MTVSNDGQLQEEEVYASQGWVIILARKCMSKEYHGYNDQSREIGNKGAHS